MYLNVAHDFTQYFIKLDGDSWINLENFPEIQGAGRGGASSGRGGPSFWEALENGFCLLFYGLPRLGCISNIFYL